MERGLFDPEFMALLERLSLKARRVYRGYSQGERRSRRLGPGVEFADHRGYQSGDDYRYLDWNLLSRLDRAFVKLSVEESELPVYILLDSSSSMDFGRPVKFQYAKAVACALSYIGLSNLDRVEISLVIGATSEDLPCGRGRVNIRRVMEFLEEARCGGGTELERMLTEFSLAGHSRGLVILLSDLMDEAGFHRGIQALGGRGFEVGIIQILSQEELSPSGSGQFQFVDSETGSRVMVSLDPATLEAYRASLEGFLREVEDFCARFGVRYIRTTTRVPLDLLVLEYLRQGGILA